MTQAIFWPGIAAIVSRATPETSGEFQSVKVVLDKLQLLGAGVNGGFFYNVYVNLPASGTAEGLWRYFLGTASAFEIAGASHHGAATLEY